MMGPAQHWYAIWTRSRHEQVVRGQLEEKGFETFLPTVTRVSRFEDIRRLLATHLPYDPCPLLKEGMMVEVVGGPLKGVAGRLVRKGTHDRLILAVNLIGRGVSVDIDAADVRAL